MDHVTAEFLSKTDINIPFDRFAHPFVRLTCMPRPPCIVRDCAVSDNAVFQFLSDIKGETRANREREIRGTIIILAYSYDQCVCREFQQSLKVRGRN